MCGTFSLSGHGAELFERLDERCGEDDCLSRRDTVRVGVGVSTYTVDLSACLRSVRSVCMSVCLTACLPACPSVCLSAFQPACLPICPPVCVSVCLPLHPSIILSSTAARWLRGGYRCLSPSSDESSKEMKYPQSITRSAERRVGKECRSWWSPYQ